MQINFSHFLYSAHDWQMLVFWLRKLNGPYGPERWNNARPKTRTARGARSRGGDRRDQYVNKDKTPLVRCFDLKGVNMKAKILAVLLAFVLAPVIMVAEDTLSQSIAGQACVVEVYHTDFAFPPEGGKIIKVGSRMYFVRDYLSGCENAGTGAVVIKGGPSLPPTQVTPTPANFVSADPCLIEVFHTNFMFPPEGGKIVQVGSRMYFVRDYLPGCQNAVPTGRVLAGGFSTPTTTAVPVPPPSTRPCDP